MSKLSEADLYNLSAMGVDLTACGINTSKDYNEAELANLYNASRKNVKKSSKKKK